MLKNNEKTLKYNYFITNSFHNRIYFHKHLDFYLIFNYQILYAKQGEQKILNNTNIDCQTDGYFC